MDKRHHNIKQCVSVSRETVIVQFNEKPVLVMQDSFCVTDLITIIETSLPTQPTGKYNQWDAPYRLISTSLTYELKSIVLVYQDLLC
jgi:hypothetical protein